MKTLNLIILMIIALSVNAQKLEKIWSSAADLKTPESVLYNQEMDIVFVACMGSETELGVEDGDGYLAQMNLKGEITKAKWIANLNDPKGMAILEGKLYCADKNELVVVDIKKGKVIQKYLAPEALFLNDVCLSDNGVIFVSDMKGQSIYSLENNEFKMWLQDDRFPWVNGLWAEKGKLYAGNSSVWEIDIATKEIKELFDGTGGIDGLETIGNGNFIFSNWGGKIYVSNNGKVIKLLDYSDEKRHTADLDFIPKTKMVLVPTFFENNVDAYQLVW